MLKNHVGITALLICLILATLPTALCAKPSTMDHTKIITDEANGKTIVIKNGDEFSLILIDLPGARNFWDISNACLSDGLKLVKESNINLGEPGIIGGPVMHIVEIKAVKTGSQCVTIDHLSMGKVDETFKLNVKVKC